VKLTQHWSDVVELPSSGHDIILVWL